MNNFQNDNNSCIAEGVALARNTHAYNPFIDAAEELMQQGRIDLAKEYLARALELNPADTMLLSMLKSLNNILKKNNDVKNCDNFVNSQNLNDLGMSLIALGSETEGIKFLYKAAETSSPDFYEPCLNLAIALDNAGRSEEALDTLIKGRSKNAMLASKTNAFLESLLEKVAAHISK